MQQNFDPKFGQKLCKYILLFKENLCLSKNFFGQKYFLFQPF